MTYNDFEKYIVYYTSENILDKVYKLLSEAINVPFAYDKLRLYINECNCGKVVKEYYIHNGREKVVIDSIKKLWYFINEE